jgi:hypothetical protein
VEFTPAATISPGKEAILELIVDTRYLTSDLGLAALYHAYGVDTADQNYIDNGGYNIVYKTLPTQWINGLPYSCWTSTASLPEQTCVHVSSSVARVVHLLETGYTANVPYRWKTPLLLNPQLSNVTFRMNLTLYTYQVGSAGPQKELFS